MTGVDDAPDELQPEGTFTVSQLAELINTRLRAGYDDGVWVRGEIQGRSARGPHAYFTSPTTSRSRRR